MHSDGDFFQFWPPPALSAGDALEYRLRSAS
jgi:hypothetical protein